MKQAKLEQIEKYVLKARQISFAEMMRGKLNRDQILASMDVLDAAFDPIFAWLEKEKPAPAPEKPNPAQPAGGKGSKAS